MIQGFNSNTYLKKIFFFKGTGQGDQSGSQSVEHLTPGIGSGHDLRVVRSGLCQAQARSLFGDSRPPFAHASSLSLKIK